MMETIAIILLVSLGLLVEREHRNAERRRRMEGAVSELIHDAIAHAGAPCGRDGRRCGTRAHS
jgi:hypothetical protein